MSVAHFAVDTGVLTGRSLRHILRSPDTIISTAVTPVAIMLLFVFVFVFGGAIDTSLAVVVGVALLLGFRSPAGVAAWLAVTGILILFTLALTWLAVIAGLSAKTVDGASAFSYPLIFLPFISSAFVPTETMPGPVAWFAENQPVTPIVNAIRALSPDSPPAARSGSPWPGVPASSSWPSHCR